MTVWTGRFGLDLGGVDDASPLPRISTPVIRTTIFELQSLQRRLTGAVVRMLDDQKDYVYSSQDDSQLCSYLIEQGIIKTYWSLRMVC